MSHDLQSLYRARLKSCGYEPPSPNTWMKEFQSIKERLSESAIPEEGNKEAVEALRFISKGEPPVNQVIAGLAKEIEDAAGEWPEMSLPCSVLCRAFPKVDFNAIAEPTELGALLLVNEGLVFLVYHCLEIFGHAAELPGCPEATLLSQDDAIAALVDAFNAYFSETNALFQLGKRFPKLEGVRGSLVDRFAESTCRFVVGHEYGHLYAGHVTTNRGGIQNRLPNGTPPDVIPTDWLLEYRADVLAMRLVFPPSRRKVDSEDQLLEATMRLAGPLIFFSIAEIIDWISSIYNYTANGIQLSVKEYLGMIDDQRTHPPTVLRIKHIHEWARVIGGSHLLGMGEQFLAWLTDHRKSVVTRIVGKLQH